jgi:hypothetical protein
MYFVLCVPEVNVRYIAAELRKLGDNELALECFGHQLCALAQHSKEIKALVERITYRAIKVVNNEKRGSGFRNMHCKCSVGSGPWRSSLNYS